MILVFAACGSGGSDGDELDIVISDQPSSEDATNEPEPYDPPSDESDPPPDKPSFGEGDSIPAAAVEAVGKTYAQLKAEFPDAYTDKNGADMYQEMLGAAFPYMTAPGLEFGFVFYGTQWGPSLSDVVKYFGDEITCIGVTGNVGGLFLDVSQDMPFEVFFPRIGVKDYNFSDYSSDQFKMAELSFKYMGFDVLINASEVHLSQMVNLDLPVLMTQGDLLLNDHYLGETHELMQ